MWEAFGRTAAYLPLMSISEKGWTPTLFVTLTHPSWSDITRLTDDAYRWLYDVRNITKTHLRVLAGYEDKGNPHIHMRVSVPNDELEFFNSRRDRISKYRFWRWRSDIQDFRLDLIEENYSYIVEKHAEIHFGKVIDLCPQRYARCRKGNCEHKNMS